MRGLRQVAAALVVALVAACGSPDAFVSPNAQISAADVQRIYLATDRVLAPDLSGTTERGGALSFAQYDITIPPGHQPGEVEFSATNPNPNASFTVADAQALTSLPELGRTVRREAGPLGRPMIAPWSMCTGSTQPWSMPSTVMRRSPMITGCKGRK